MTISTCRPAGSLRDAEELLGPAARSEQARRTLCGRVERIRKLGERLCLVSARDKKFARHSPTPGSVGVPTDLHPVDVGTDHQGETPSGPLEGAESSSNPTAWRRESAMRAWFVPPLVIPIFVVLMVMAFATYQAL